MNELAQAALIAFVKALLKQYPGLAWGAVLLEIQNVGEGALKALEEWWKLEMPEPWPGMPPMDQEHGQDGPAYDPSQL